MNIILVDEMVYSRKIEDFGVDPVSKRIIATGKKLIFSKEGKIEKEVGGKVKNCKIIKYIKDKTQLFVSGIFFVSTASGKVYKCDGRRKKIVEEVYSFQKDVEVAEFTTGGKIIYIQEGTIYLYDENTKELVTSSCLNGIEEEGDWKIFTSGENIILRYGKEGEKSNRIIIFCGKLEKIFDIKTDDIHVFSKIVGVEYIAGTAAGEVEIWDILESELYNSIKISDCKITYIEKTGQFYLIGTEKGDVIVTDEKFKILSQKNIMQDEISKICVIEDEVFVLGKENRIMKFRLFDERDQVKSNIKRLEFLQKYNIHEDYYEFFTIFQIVEIEEFLKEMKIKGIEYVPKEEDIFRGFTEPLSSKKVCLMGKEPYLGKGEATGLAFELKRETWDLPEIKTSLKNILEMLYKVYKGKRKETRDIIEEINSGKFNILPPDRLFISWDRQGVLLLNKLLISLPERENKEEVKENNKLWTNFTDKLLKYISRKNENMIYMSWEKDFLSIQSFKDTKNIVNWLGEK